MKEKKLNRKPVNIVLPEPVTLTAVTVSHLQRVLHRSERKIISAHMHEVRDRAINHGTESDD